MINKTDMFMITRRGVLFVTKGTFGQLTCEWQYTFDEFTKEPFIVHGRRLRIEAKERVKSVFHAKEFGKSLTSRLQKMLGGSSQSWKKRENHPRDCEEGRHAVQRHGNPLLQLPRGTSSLLWRRGVIAGSLCAYVLLKRQNQSEKQLCD